MAIQRALSDIDDITTAKEKIMAEGVAMNDNLNAVEDLMKVHTKAMEKQAVFDQFREQYTSHFAKIEELEAQRQQIAMTISQNAPAFQQLLSGQLQDPAKSQFFQQLNDAIVANQQM